MIMVPPIIHQIVGSTPSKLVEVCLSSWAMLGNVGFKVLYWDDAHLERFIKAHYLFAMDAFATARNHAEAADIARYLLVYHFGGYYVDWDISLNDRDAFIALAERESKGYVVIDPKNQTIASEHFSAMAGNRYLIALVKDIVATYERDERDLMRTPQYSGPYRMRSTLRKFARIDQSQIPTKEIFEYTYDEIREQKAYRKNGIMTHFWEHSWM